jgi:DNA gyrase subunit B
MMNPLLLRRNATKELDMKVKGISGETKVSLLNGKEKRLCDVTENYQGEPIFLYTVESKRVNVGVAWSPRCFGKSETLIITLDNKEEVICSPNQKMLLRDGSTKKAKQLDAGQSLMPLYRETQTKGYLRGYERVYRSEKNTPSYYYTHQMVGKWKFGKRYSRHSGFDLHHLDFDKTNNDPTNIDLLPRPEHQDLHEKRPKLRYRNDTELRAYREKRIPRPTKSINHAIVKIERGPRESLYGLIVMETEIFALSSGVFIVGL